MLRVKISKYYKVKEGQTLRNIAEPFGVAERLLVKENALVSPPFVGQILRIPDTRGNAYTAKAGETKTLLCGNEEGYERKNGTDILYIGMRVIL